MGACRLQQFFCLHKCGGEMVAGAGHDVGGERRQQGAHRGHILRQRRNGVGLIAEGKQAHARVQKGAVYDVVFCDLMMPVMTGMDLYAEIVRAAPRLAGRLVFMTGGAFTPRARAFLENVVNPCLEKPLDTSKLRSIVARAAGKD